MSRDRRNEGDHALCGPDCRYRGLYEGSQRSLADMASRQADALGRIGRMRSQIVLGLKRMMPKEFTEAERSLGRRLSEVDDELLGAYLESFLLLTAGKNTAEAGALNRVKDALRRLGLDAHRAQNLAEVADILEARATTGISELGDLFADEHPAGPQTALAAPEASAPQAGTSPLAVPPSPGAPLFVRAGQNPVSQPAQPAAPVTPAQSAPAAAPSAAPARQLATPPATPSNQPAAAPTLTPPPRPYDDPSYTGEMPTDLDDLFADERAAEAPVAAPARPSEKKPAAPAAVVAEKSAGEKTSPEKAASPTAGAGSAASGELDDLFWGEGGDNMQPAGAAAVAPGVAEQPTPEKAPDAAAAPAEPALPSAPSIPDVTKAPTNGSEVTARAVAATGGMRPTLLPQVPKTRQRKPTKSAVRARVTPGESSPDVPIDQGEAVALDDAVRDRLMAAVCIPRPVFTADLVDLIKSPEIVAEWQSQSISELSIQVIPPKSRHKLRGALIFPKNHLKDASAEFKRSLWARCMSEYLGAKLYELGVLLHRFGDEVVGAELGSSVVLMRLARPQGLVGVVVVLDPALGEGEPARKDLVAALETLMHERLVELAILSTNAEIINVIADVVAEEAASREWTPSMPVTLAKSWEYANGTGVAIPLLGV